MAALECRPMRSVLKFLFAPLAAVSLLLFALVVAMWIRSYVVHDQWLLSKNADGTAWIWLSADGRVGRAVSGVDPINGRRVAMFHDEEYYTRWAGTFGILPFMWL